MLEDLGLSYMRKNHKDGGGIYAWWVCRWMHLEYIFKNVHYHWQSLLAQWKLIPRGSRSSIQIFSVLLCLSKTQYASLAHTQFYTITVIMSTSPPSMTTSATRGFKSSLLHICWRFLLYFCRKQPIQAYDAFNITSIDFLSLTIYTFTFYLFPCINSPQWSVHSSPFFSMLHCCWV